MRALSSDAAKQLPPWNWSPSRARQHRMHGIEKPAPTVCVACRLSKVKCDLQRIPAIGDGCGRCSRLGLACRVVASRRGQKNVKRDVARLGPAVRQMLADDSRTSSSSSECHLAVLGGICSDKAKLMLLKHWLLIGVHSQDSLLIGSLFVLANSCGFTRVDAFQLHLQVSAPNGPNDPSQPALSMPLFLREWFEDPLRACYMCVQHEGRLQYEGNVAFSHQVAALSSLEAQLQSDPAGGRSGEGGNNGGRGGRGGHSAASFGFCKAELLLATALHPDDRARLMQMLAALWTKVGRGNGGSEDSSRDDGGGVGVGGSVGEGGGSGRDFWQAAAEAPALVRCARAAAEGTRTFTLCTLRGRMAVANDARLVGIVVSLTPAGAQPPTCLVPPHVAPVAALATTPLMMPATMSSPVLAAVTAPPGTLLPSFDGWSAPSRPSAMASGVGSSSTAEEAIAEQSSGGLADLRELDLLIPPSRALPFSSLEYDLGDAIARGSTNMADHPLEGLDGY